MKFGVPVGNFGAFGNDPGIEGCLEVARRAEELGFDSIWVHDHVIIPESIEARYPYNATGDFPVTWEAEIYEPLVMMNALAAITKRVRIGVSVLVIPYRHPAVTAKMLATADQISGGRITLGAGVGWMRDEFEALGLPPEHFEHRGTVTSEYLAAMKEMWTNTGPSNFSGRFVQFSDVGTFPKPVQQPHIPIVIGGKGPAALRRASRLGNGFQAIAVTPEQLHKEVTALRAVCALDRRDPDELEISMLGGMRFTEQPEGPDRDPLSGSVEQIAEDLRAFGKAGLNHLVATPFLAAGESQLERIGGGMELAAAELLPAFAG